MIYTIIKMSLHTPYLLKKKEKLYPLITFDGVLGTGISPLADCGTLHHYRPSHYMAPPGPPPWSCDYLDHSPGLSSGVPATPHLATIDLKCLLWFPPTNALIEHFLPSD